MRGVVVLMMAAIAAQSVGGGVRFVGERIEQEAK
jgi:hypothetical protein